MIARWIEDLADRLETAAELVREVNAGAWVSSDVFEELLASLERRLDETAQRIGVLRSLTPDTKRRYAHGFEDLHTLATRCLRFACAEECGAAYESIDMVAAELATITIELQTLEHLDGDSAALPPLATVARGGRR